MSSLAELATKHGTDKWNGHWYAQHYDRYFAHLREREVRVLEIGIGGYLDPRAGGQSLRMWKDYFTRGTVVGLDINDKTPHREDRIHTVQGSQADTQVLERLIADHGPFDVIIDDGSHLCAHVIASFEYLFVWGLVEGGIYAAEDLETSYWPGMGGSLSLDATDTSMGYFKRLADAPNWVEWHRPAYTPSYFDEHVFGVHFHHGLAFVEKKRSNEKSTLVKNNRVPLGYLSPTRARAVRAVEKSLDGLKKLRAKIRRAK